MTKHMWTVDYQVFPDEISPLGVPTGACFAYRNGEEIDCAEIERRLNEYDKLKKATEGLSAENETLLRHGSFMDYKGRCEQYLHCRLCDSKWLWENDEPSEHKDDCPLYVDILEGK